ncbi:uncharacterized protein LOC110634266 [Hevea brasiliensis]|uniref:uncharacterized protein LOC110634266 n=1 Tax=Hevea brasiliensis TaxID=3981 RepID=UPI0025E36BC5|nr:uncharacterized protein LOC110634266 [Hevea brasiliensis]
MQRAAELMHWQKLLEQTLKTKTMSWQQLLDWLDRIRMRRTTINGLGLPHKNFHTLDYNFGVFRQKIHKKMPKYHQCQNPPSSSHLHNFTGGKDDRDALAYAGCVLSIPE